MTKIVTATCPTCGVTVASMEEHLALIAERRAKYGPTWGLKRRKVYEVVEYEDVVTAPTIPY